jgi:hypothetical protein
MEGVEGRGLEERVGDCAQYPVFWSCHEPPPPHAGVQQAGEMAGSRGLVKPASTPRVARMAELGGGRVLLYDSSGQYIDFSLIMS